MLALAGGGDDGTTALLGGGRLAKDEPRIEAYGTVDEASSAIGLAKALAADPRAGEILEEVQQDLYRLGAEIATSPTRTGAFGVVSADDVARLDSLTAELEAEVAMPEGFVLPGMTPASGALDLARAIVRRAERRCVALARTGGIENPQVTRYLNRLSLVLFVLGRFEEERSGRPAKLARRRA